MLAKKTSKNQLTLPKDIVKAFADAEYFDVTAEKNRIVLVPVKITRADATLESIRDKMGKTGHAGSRCTGGGEMGAKAKKASPGNT